MRVYTVQQLLQENGVPVLTLKTVYSWMSRLGCSYDDHCKIYFVDSHAKIENVGYQGVRSHRWISIPIHRFENMVRKGELMKEQGYKYEDERGDT